MGARWVGVWGVRAVGERVAGRGLACGACVWWVCLGCECARGWCIFERGARFTFCAGPWVRWCVKALGARVASVARGARGAPVFGGPRES